MKTSIDKQMEEYETMAANELRSECRKNKVMPATHTKASYLKAIHTALVTGRAIAATGAVYAPNNTISQHRTADSVFRLLNVIFSNAFCERFADHGDPAKRRQLDTRSVDAATDF